MPPSRPVDWHVAGTGSIATILCDTIGVTSCSVKISPQTEHFFPSVKPVEKQVAILYAVTRGLLAAVQVDRIREYEAGLYTFLDTDPDGVAAMQEIRETGKLEEGTEAKLKAAIDETGYTLMSLSSETVEKKKHFWQR